MFIKALKALFKNNFILLKNVLQKLFCSKIQSNIQTLINTEHIKANCISHCLRHHW